jgi:antitoxin PrlF
MTRSTDTDVVMASDEGNAGDHPALLAFLGFLERSMREHPELLRPLTASDVAGLDELLEGVEVDLDTELGDDEYTLPDLS